MDISMEVSMEISMWVSMEISIWPHANAIRFIVAHSVSVNRRQILVFFPNGAAGLSLRNAQRTPTAQTAQKRP